MLHKWTVVYLMEARAAAMSPASMTRENPWAGVLRNLRNLGKAAPRYASIGLRERVFGVGKGTAGG